MRKGPSIPKLTPEPDRIWAPKKVLIDLLASQNLLA